MNQIKAIRKAMGLSAEQIASAICVAPATVYRWESGECDLPSLMLCRLADLLGVTMDALLGRKHQDAPIPVRDTIATMVKDSGLTYLQLESLTGIPHSALQRYVAGTTEKIPMDRVQRLVDVLQKLGPMGYRHTERPKKEGITMKQTLYRVGIKHKKTGEKITLRVWAENNNEATHSLNRTLIGPSNEYHWTGTGPEHDERGNLITREVAEEANV